MQEISWKNILIELLIVFVGVYGAFLLNSYREGIQADEARVKYYKTFLSDLNHSLKRSKILQADLDSTITKVKTGDADSLPYNRDLDFTSTFYILESAYSDENFASINTQYLINIEFGSNLIKEIETRFTIMNSEVRKYKIYGSSFGVKTGTNFKQWYIDELIFLSDKLSLLIQNIEEGAIPGTEKLIEHLQ